MTTEPLHIAAGAGAATGAPPIPDPAELRAAADGDASAPGAVTADAVAAQQGTTAAKLRAKYEQLKNRGTSFPVPPVDVWGNDLVVQVKAVDLKNQKNLELIAEATTAVLLRNDDTGDLEPVEGAWEGLGDLMGITGGAPVTVGQIITAVCSSKDVVHSLALDIVGWIRGITPGAEQALGK